MQEAHASPLTEKQHDDHHARTTRLKFAGTHIRLHPEDLPHDYEPGEVYRGLDEYIAARRSARRRAHRLRRTSGTRESERNQDSDSDSDSDSSDSDSSNGPQVISRLLSLFGDNSDHSSSDSSTDDDDSDRDSDSSTSSTTSRARSSRDVDPSDHISLASGRSRREMAGTSTPGASSAFAPWTPRLSALTGTRRRRKRRRHANRRERPVHIVKASRMARRNARRLRELSGGITEYTLFAPTGDSRSNVVVSQSWRAIWDRMEHYFSYHRQNDGLAGDLGLPMISSPPAPTTVESIMGDENLALPSPALELHVPDRAADSPRDPHAEAFEHELQTGRHMSDMPLTPFFRSNISGDVIPSPMPFGSLSTGRATSPRQERMSPFPNHGKVSPIPEEPGDLQLPEAALDIYGYPEPAIADSVKNEDITEASIRSDPWWLDIRCPTYKDMQQLGQHFPLHPLTVEDILKQEQREKVETFERLGYYFVVLRALDENYFRFTKPAERTDDTREKHLLVSPGLVEAQVPSTPLPGNVEPKPNVGSGRVHIETVKSEDAKEGLEGLNAGAVTLYLVVFSYGVLSFHFEDVHKHTDKVRDRLNSSFTMMERSSDWIVHALYDSIVDAFFPYVSFLQHEVEYVNYLSNDLSLTPFKKDERVSKQAKRFFTKPLFAKTRRKRDTAFVAEEILRALPKGNAEYVEYLTKRAKKQKAFSTYDAMDQSHFILRLARVREVVMGLTRLLVPKADVVRALRKRLVDMDRPERKNGLLGMYFDDIFDHIASMLAQLQERETSLKYTHSSFFARVSMISIRFQIHIATVITLATMVIDIVFFITLFCTTFSMNLYIPANAQPDKEHRPNDCEHMHKNSRAFAGIASSLVVFPFFLYSYYRYAVFRSKARSKRSMESR